ncbi:VCBS domain-containing protein [Bradyrhizobium campsiandrae]|nr:VCBS domain-containing protein [Bradyrhizobium campsiandrae]
MPDGAVVIADPNLIFHGDFKRSGLDLVLSHDGHDVVLHDYFRGDKRAAIASPDGAHLTGDIVNALTGYVQVAQAAPGAAAAQVIGHVTKLTGSATAIRNGVSVILNNGDNVEKGDVVSTGSDSTLGVTFIDGTVFGLSSNARMVLNEMVYDPNGSNNSSLLSLVAGTITFVAGETAKHGDMKIDTPVATMGIRGTAVLTEINFVVPSGGGDPQPQANFQVLVEPNGTTGSYILFDKLTLLPIATVNQAGQMIQISGGNVSVTNALLSPDVQKLITDVFTLKFTDNNTNTKLTTNFTDTITQNGNIVVIKTDTGATATATFTNPGNSGTTPGQSGQDKGADRFPGAPRAASLDANGTATSSFALKEHAGATADRADANGAAVGPDTVTIRINFVDQNLGDRPTVSVDLGAAPNYVYMDAGKHDVTGSLNALQKQDIAATQIQISVAADAGNTNNGSATLTYTIPDHVFDFLGAGETLTLTYMVHVNDNFAINPESNDFPITITITGTNDKPVITTSVPTITFSGGTSTAGGSLATKVPTAGTLTFTDVDLTDTHTVAVSKFSAVLPGGTVPQSIHDFFAADLSVSIASGHDSTGSGTGTVNWSLGDIPVYLADFIPKGEVLTLTYTVTVTDSQGATSDQTITVTITGTDAPAVVWIATNKPSGGFWKTGANWETGVAPTIDDDVIVITDQLHGLTPSYPVTIDIAAFGKSLTMDDYDKTAGHTAPEVVNHSTLTLAGELKLNADAKFTNAADGTVLVGGAIDVETITRTNGEVVINTAAITNAGYLTLAAGGTIDTLTTIVNSGTIALSGGPLQLSASIANAGGTVQVDSAANLIVDGATIDGGTLNIMGALVLEGASLIENGALDVDNFGGVYVQGVAEFANEAVHNAGKIEVLADRVLTIDQGSDVNNQGDLTVDGDGKLIVNGATIDGGKIVVLPGAAAIEGGESDSTFTLVLPGTGTVTNNGELDLTGNAVLSNGVLKNNGTLDVSGAGNALNDEAVTNAGIIEVLTGALAIGPGSTVDNSSGKVVVDAALILNDATISGGAIKGVGSIDVIGASTIDKGATLSVATVTADAKLTLDGITVSASVISDNASIELDNTVQLKGGARIQGGHVTNAGTLEISGAATLLNDVVTNNGTVQVDGSQALTLSNTEISGGAIDGTGTIDVTVASKIDGAATLSTSAIIADAKLTLNGITVSGSTITDNSSIELDNTVKLQDGAKIQGGPVTNNGKLEIAGAAALLNDVVTNNGTVQVDGSQTLTLSGTEISGGAINGAGAIDVTVASKIDGGATLSTSAVIADAKLTLNGITVSGSTITDNSSIELDNTVKLQDSAKIQGGPVTNNGKLDIAGAAALLNDVVTNNGTLQVDGSQTLTLSGTEISGGAINGAGAIDVTVASKIDGGATLSTSVVTADAKLTLNGITVSGSVITDNAGIELDSTVQLKGGSRIQGGPVANNGTLEIAGAAALLNDIVTNKGTVQIDDGQILTLSGTEISGGIINNYNGASGGAIGVTGDSAIDGHATLNKGVVTVGSGVVLSFGDATVSASAIANGGTVKVEADRKLTLAGATLTGGALTIAGTLVSSGISAITDTSISNTYLLESTLGGLLTLAATTPAPVITNDGGTIRANNAELDIDGEAVSNTGALSAINDGVLKLISTTVTNTDGAVFVETGSTLDLSDATIAGGTMTIAGTLESTGTSAITDADITNTGTISVTSGKLTIDPALIHTLTNSHLLQANGGELDVVGEHIVNTADIKAINGGILKLSSLGVTNDGGAVTVDGVSKLYLTAASINGGSLTNSGHLYGVSGLNTISAGVTNTGTIEVEAGTLNLSAGLTGIGTLVIDDGATLELAGATAQTVTFAGGADTLLLDKVAGQGFTGTIAGQSSKGGIFKVAGAADIAASSGDALDFTASGGTSAKPANIVLTPSGALKGAANGVVVTENGTGDISLTATGNIAGLAGNGITLRDSATGFGNITIDNLTGTATGSGANSEGILVENLNAANAGDISITQHGGAAGGAFGIEATTHGDGDITIDAGGAVTGSSANGIRARSFGSGDVTVTTEAGSAITSGSGGIVAINSATAIAKDVGSTISVIAHGTINSGPTVNVDGSPSAGIAAGYTPGLSFSTGTPTTVYGDVTVDSDATIVAAGEGIQAFTWGLGNVTVTAEAGSSITAADHAIVAFAHGGGDVAITNDGLATGAYGIEADAFGAGKITISNDGTVAGTFGAGIEVNQDLLGTGLIHITNDSHGHIAAGSGSAAISISGGTGNVLIDNSGAIGPDDATTVGSTTSAILQTGGAIAINNSGHINGNVSVASATFDNESGGTWTVSGTSVFGTLSTIDNAGDVKLLDGALVSSADGVAFAITNSGEIESWGTTVIKGAITTTDTSAIEIHTGTLTLFGSLSGSGTVKIDAGATLDVGATVSQTITFGGGSAELQIDTASFAGAVAGFATTDKLDLANIVYDGGTSATYDAKTGNLVVSDAHGHSITIKLNGDYSNAHFAGSSDGHGGTLITDVAADDKPAFNPAETSPTAVVAEQSGVTGSSSPDQSSPASGTIHFTDVDLTDRPTATVTGQSATWLDTDGHTQLTLTSSQASALENALSVLTSGKNNGSADWSYSIKDSALDFLGQGQTATVVSTITLDDHHGGTDTAQVTVTISGANDAPTLAPVTTGPLVDTAATDTFSNLTGKLAGTDADSGETATLTYAVLDAAHHATTTVAGLYGSLTVAADGSYSYVPNAAAINALTAGNYTDNFTVQTTDVHGATGTAAFKVNVTGADEAPVINIDNVSVVQNDDEFIVVRGLKVTDTDAVAGETFTLHATTVGPGSSAGPSSGSGSLASINTLLRTVTYNEGSGEPATDKIALTVADGHGATDTLNLIFNLREEGDMSRLAVTGTTGKDVFFGTVGPDQFVFAANSNHDTIVNFTSGVDLIDLRAVVTTGNISNWMAQHVSLSPANPADTLITIDAADTILLKGITHLAANDILHA